MWNAVISNSPDYDGVFYYGVKSTGIYCRPSCSSKQPCRENVFFFPDSREALEKGYRPCKRCRPDLLSPFVEPIKEVNDKVKSILETEYNNTDILSQLPSRMGVSPFHLQRSFKKQTGHTPKAYLQLVRINRAKELLSDGGLNNTEICFAIGFQSLSSFYAAFRSLTGFSPGEYKINFTISKNNKSRTQAER